MWPYRWERRKIMVPTVLGPIITAPARFHYSGVSSDTWTLRIWLPSDLNSELNYHQSHLKSEHHNFSSDVRNETNSSWLNGCEEKYDTICGYYSGMRFLKGLLANHVHKFHRTLLVTPGLSTMVAFWKCTPQGTICLTVWNDEEFNWHIGTLSTYSNRLTSKEQHVVTKWENFPLKIQSNVGTGDVHDTTRSE